MAKKVQTKQAKEVNALQFLRSLNLEWLLSRSLEEEDIDILQANVSAARDGSEWASWWLPYTRADGAPVPGISWGVSAPVNGGVLIMRLIEGGEVKATLKIYRTGKGVITGSEPVIMALLARPDLPPWDDKDLAALL